GTCSTTASSVVSLSSVATGGTCNSVVVTPTNVPPLTWATSVIACTPTTTCNSGLCVPSSSPGGTFKVCVSTSVSGTVCPSDYPMPVGTFDAVTSDTRGCTDCWCQPVDAQCSGGGVTFSSVNPCMGVTSLPVPT